jgi:hypothetical protein
MNPQTGNKRCHTDEDRTQDAKGELLVARELRAKSSIRQPTPQVAKWVVQRAVQKAGELAAYFPLQLKGCGAEREVSTASPG